MENTTTKKPDDFVVATGNTYSVKQFINTSAKILKMKIIWEGKRSQRKSLSN